MIGKRLAGRYELLRELGRGGMGVVYVAADPVLDREVAIKVMLQSGVPADAHERFQREARVVAKLEHPAIVTVHDIGEDEGSLFFVMPFIRGVNLRTALEEGSLSLADVVETGIQVAEALDYSHQRGVVHRDIKPENVLLVREDGTLRVYLTDFGLAMATSESRMTRSGLVIGTVTYLSPEQVEAGRVDGRADIYALGNVLYECVTGAAPFAGEVPAVFYRILGEEPRPPSALTPGLPEELSGLVMECLSKDPARRPQRGRDLAAALRRCRDAARGAVPAPKAAPATDTRPTRRAPPFAGREAELTELKRRLDAAIAGECQLALVAGDAGIGKSRLVAELASAAGTLGVPVLSGRHVEQDRAFPYEGFCELLLSHFRRRDSAVARKVDFSDLAPHLVALFPVLNEIADLRSSVSSGQTAARKPVEHRNEVFDLLARTFTRIGGGEPLVLVLEDLHNADLTLDALQYVVRRLGPTRTLVLGTYRPPADRRHPLHALIQSFRGDRRFTLLLLPPLSPAAHRRFVAALLGAANVETSLAARLHEVTEGNPSFTEEIVRALADAGDITLDGTGSVQMARGDLSPENLPLTLQEAVERRVERLSEDERALLSVLSVVGNAFAAREAAALAGESDELEDHLSALVKKGFLSETREGRSIRFAFASALVRDALYAALPRGRKRALHRRMAADLEARHAGRLALVSGALLHHYAEGDVSGKAVTYGLLHARDSLAAFSPEEAARAARTALDFLEDAESVESGEAHELLGEAYRTAGRPADALKSFGRAADLFARHGRFREAALSRVNAAEAAWESRQVEEAERRIGEALPSARASGDRESLKRLLELGATVANLKGDHVSARALLEEAERLSPEPRAEEPAERGGTLVVTLPAEVGAAYPIDGQILEEAEILGCVFETLLATDARGVVVPNLAEAWQLLDDGRTLELTLRSGVVFHDGRALDAQAVKDSVENAVRRTTRPLPAAFAAIRGVQERAAGGEQGSIGGGAPEQTGADSIAGLTVVSDRVLHIALVESLPIYPALLTDLRTAIALPARPVDAAAPTTDRAGAVEAVGSGPFRLESVETRSLRLAAVKEHWKAAPHVERLEFRVIPGSAEAAWAFRAGEVDVARDLLPRDVEDILGERRTGARLVDAPRKNVHFAVFAARSALGGNPELRRALFASARTHDLVRAALGRFADPAEGLIPPGVLGHDPGRRRDVAPREEALRALEAGGLTPPFRLAAAAHPVFQERYAAFTTELVRSWAALGVEVTIETPSLRAYRAALEEGHTHDLLLGRWTPDYDDPDGFAVGLFHSRAGLLRAYVSSPELDRSMEEARQIADAPRREKAYRRLETELLRNHLVLPLFHDLDYRLVSPRVKRLALVSTPPFVDYASVVKSSAPVPRQKKSGLVRVAAAGTLSTLDPVLGSLALCEEVLPNVFENLTREREGARVVPWLAADVREEDGARRFRFRLRPDVRFHDGRRLSARDVRHTFERLLKTRESPNHWLLSSVKGAREVVEGTAPSLSGFTLTSLLEFTIELVEPVPFFPAMLAFTPLAIVAEGALGVSGTWRDGAAGTGPFRVVEFEPGRRLLLEANPEYWRKGLPKSERLEFLFGVPPPEIRAGFEAGRFALAWDLYPPDVEELRKKPELASRYREAPSLSTGYVAFSRNGALADVRLRRRLVRALKREDLVVKALGRLAVPAGSLIPPGLLGAGAPERRDTESAAPLPTGLALVVSNDAVFDGPYAPLLSEIVGVLRDAGARVEPRGVAGPGSVAGSDVHVGRWIADYPDADSFISGLLATEGGRLGRLIGEAELDASIRRARASSDPAFRHDVYREIEERLAREALVVPLFHEQAYRFSRPEVEGLDVSFSKPFVAYDKLWVRE